MSCVLDCMFCAALFLPHEKSAAVKEAFQRFGEDAEILVPCRFWDEAAELLSAALSHKRLSYSDALEINRLLGLYRFNTDAACGSEQVERLLNLSRLYGLGPGDAAYLELALRKKASVGTLNGTLRAACARAGVETLL